MSTSLRYFFHIAYHGTRYNGWQKLPHNTSVQHVIETQLSNVVKLPVTIVGCGRTDSRVHASQYFFHADLPTISISELLFRLNKMLPDDIAVFDILPVDDQAHARLSAIERTYTYYLHRSKDPFLNIVSALYPHNFDLSVIKKALTLLPTHNDYRFFHRTASHPKTTICHVTHAKLFVDESGDRLKFIISANRFLSGMVRIIVHRLLQAGRQKLTITQFEDYLNGTQTPANIKSAHPQGLYLSRVKYPFIELPVKSKFDLFVDKGSRWQEVD